MYDDVYEIKKSKKVIKREYNLKLNNIIIISDNMCMSLNNKEISLSPYSLLMFSFRLKNKLYN